MIRIRTKAKLGTVYTITDHNGGWITMATKDGRNSFYNSNDLFSAGQTHLRLCEILNRSATDSTSQEEF